MSLPNGYTLKVGAIPAYLDAILNAEAPPRFSHKFLEGIGFASSNDRRIIGILKDLGFLDQDGTPKERYYSFLDRTVSEKVLAEGIKEAFSDLFSVNKSAHELTVTEAYNKLRTLYKGAKKDTVVKEIAKTFRALCEYADFSQGDYTHPTSTTDEDSLRENEKSTESEAPPLEKSGKSVELKSLQYHINIVLPDTRDQSVYDAIFKSLRDHLG